MFGTQFLNQITIWKRIAKRRKDDGKKKNSRRRGREERDEKEKQTWNI